MGQRPADPPGTIDGAKNPELIPDKIAYSILFRFLSDRQTDEEKRSVRAYLQQRLGDGCEESENITKSVDAAIDALLAAAERFNRRVAVLDGEVRGIKNRHWPNPPPYVMARLSQLQGQKEAAALEAASSLRAGLNADGAARVRRLIDESFRRKIKVTPGAQSPPGGPGWRNLPAHH